MIKKIAPALLAIVSIGISACHNEKEKKEEIARYMVTTPLVMDTSFTKEYVAQIQSLQNVELRAKVSGYLDKIHVDEGQNVKEGQLLFTIRSVEYDAELAKAKAEVKEAELEVQNVSKLSEKNIVAPNELAMAKAKLDEARAEQAKAELYLSYTSIRAPFSGTIDRLRFKVGSLIDEGTLLTTISNNNEMYAYFNVSETEYLDYRSRPKDDAQNLASLMLANNTMHKYKGMIETVEGEFDNATGTIAFRAKFPNKELLLKHGETGKVLLNSKISNAIIIPQKATYEVQDKVYVYVVDRSNVIHSRNITIRQKLPDIFILDSGLSPDERFLLEGIQMANDDDKIEPVMKPINEVMASFKKQ